jgi:hypothetical protein
MLALSYLRGRTASWLAGLCWKLLNLFLVLVIVLPTASIVLLALTRINLEDLRPIDPRSFKKTEVLVRVQHVALHAETSRGSIRNSTLSG